MDEALDILAPPPAPVLLAVNAQVPDGRDTRRCAVRLGRDGSDSE